MEEKQVQALAREFLQAWHQDQRIQGGSASAMMAPHSLLIFNFDGHDAR